MKNPFRSKATRIKEVLVELETCQGQINGLMDVSFKDNVEKVTGPIDMSTLAAISRSIAAQHDELSFKDARGISEMFTDRKQRLDQRFMARDEIVADVDAEIAKTGGLRGMLGLHGKNLGEEISGRAILAIEKASAYSGLANRALPVCDPFGRPTISAKHTKPDYNTPGW